MFGYENLSQRDKLIALILGGVIIVILVFIVVIKPKLDQLSLLNKKIETEQTELVSERNNLIRLQELEKNFENNEMIFTKLKKQLPEKVEMPSTIIELSKIYADEKIELIKLAPSDFKDENGVGTYQIILESSQQLSIYPVISLLRRYESQNRFFRVVSVDLKVEEDDRGNSFSNTQVMAPESKLKTAFTLKSYSLEIPVDPNAAAIPQPTSSQNQQPGQGQGGGS